MELPHLFDVFDLEESSITPEEAERAVLRFINQVEEDWERPFPAGLLKFIAKGLRVQYESGNITAWTRRKSGRPPVAPYDSLNILAWYLCNIDTRFCNLPKTVGSGRYFKVAELFKLA